MLDICVGVASDWVCCVVGVFKCSLLSNDYSEALKSQRERGVSVGFLLSDFAGGTIGDCVSGILSSCVGSRLGNYVGAMLGG